MAKLLLILALLTLSACVKPPPVERTETYHRPAPASTRAPQRAPSALQKKAILAINDERYDEAIGYLQRAIKIDPRDARSWHYLAQVYWHKQDYPQCRAMVRRAMSYSQQNPDLQKANKTLLRQCFE
jgi:Tfp pilus assembly protein PilF